MDRDTVEGMLPMVRELERLLARAREILVERHTEPTEGGVILSGLLFGIFVLLPFDGLAAPAFRVLLTVAPENAWGLLALAYTTAMLIGIAGYSLRLRLYGVATGLVYWAFIAACAWLASPRTPAWLIYGLIAAAAVWAFLRVSRRQRE